MNPELCKKCSYAVYYEEFWDKVCISDTCPDNIESKKHPKERMFCNCQRLKTNSSQVILEYVFDKYGKWVKCSDFRDKKHLLKDFLRKLKLTEKLENWSAVPENCAFEQEQKLYEWNKHNESGNM